MHSDVMCEHADGPRCVEYYNSSRSRGSLYCNLRAASQIRLWQCNAGDLVYHINVCARFNFYHYTVHQGPPINITPPIYLEAVQT